MKVKEIVRVTKGRLVSGDPEREIDLSMISTDSRTLKKGEVFLALDGPNFKGSSFLNDAFRKKAIGAIINSCRSKKTWAGKIVIEVEDTLKALQDIASRHRECFDIPVIAVTGSNGKTTVKEMIACILSKKYNVLKNEGTKNNHIGVPQTILKLKRSHDICVLELGTNHEGEIKMLGSIAKPTIAVLTNIGPSHLEFFKDLNGVFRAKIEILATLRPPRPVVIINSDDEYLSRIKNDKLRIIRYGLGEHSDFRARLVSTGRNRIKFIVNEKYEYEINLLGIHNVYNALAAISAASIFKIPYRVVRKSVYDYKPAYMRLNLKNINGLEVIDDSYNSNPLSMKSALDVICNYHARSRWVVTGDMMELGRMAESFHKMIGRAIAESKIEGLLTLGKLSKYTLSEARKYGMKSLWHCSTHGEIADILNKVARSGDAVLIKGSRGMRMEEVIKKLKAKKREG